MKMKNSVSTLLAAFVLLLSASQTLIAGEANKHFNQGYEKHLNGDLNSAIKDYSKAIEHDPRFAMAYQMRGAAWQRMKAFDKAINDFSMVIAFGEAAFQAVGYYNRGIAKNMSGDFSGAIPDFGQAILLDKKMAAAYFHRGIAKGRTGDTFGRIEDFREAARLGSVEAEEWLKKHYPSWRQPFPFTPYPQPAN